jgi:8-oxo-dGTP pyrophosphatase MutT (NUDIX family)
MIDGVKDNWRVRTTRIMEAVQGKAFESLSFRGKFNNHHKTGERDFKRTRVYGGIISVKNEKGENKYVVVQGRYTRKWSFPKGHSKKGESSLECSLREIKEETGLDTLPEPKEYIKIGYGGYYIFELNSEVSLRTNDKSEIINTKWMTLEEMSEIDMNADGNEFIKKMRDII